MSDETQAPLPEGGTSAPAPSVALRAAKWLTIVSLSAVVLSVLAFFANYSELGLVLALVAGGFGFLAFLAPSSRGQQGQGRGWWGTLGLVDGVGFLVLVLLGCLALYGLMSLNRSL
jgi:hypothetical protein